MNCPGIGMNSILKQFWDYDNIIGYIRTIQNSVELNIPGNFPIRDQIIKNIDGGIV